jgi:hypothetical protein
MSEGEILMSNDSEEPIESYEMPSTAYRESVAIPWWSSITDALGSIDTGKLALAGVIWYSFLAVTYNRFYEPLGIQPSDVGLGYASILANSVGTALAVFVPIIAFTLILLFLILLVARLRVYSYLVYRLTSRERGRAFIPGSTYIFLMIAALALLVMYQLSAIAGNQAGRVITGASVSPVHLVFSPAPVLPIQAHPVLSIAPSANKKAGEISAVESIDAKGLLYMGQANGVIVLYSSNEKRAIYLPASSVILTVDISNRSR